MVSSPWLWVVTKTRGVTINQTDTFPVIRDDMSFVGRLPIEIIDNSVIYRTKKLTCNPIFVAYSTDPIERNILSSY